MCGCVWFCWGVVTWVCLFPRPGASAGLPPLCLWSREYDLVFVRPSRVRASPVFVAGAASSSCRRAHGRSTTFPWVLPRSVLREYGLTLRDAVWECSRRVKAPALLLPGLSRLWLGCCQRARLGLRVLGLRVRGFGPLLTM